MTHPRAEPLSRTVARLALACAAFIALLAMFAEVAYAQQRAVAEKPVRLAIDHFVMRAGASRFDSLQAAIPAIVRAALLSDEHLFLIGPEGLSSLRDRHSAQPGAHGTSYWQEIDYLLRGSYLEIQGRIVVTGVLVQASSGNEIKLPQVTIDQRRLVPGIELLAASVSSALRKEGAGGRTRYFAVACFEDRSDAPGSTSQRARREIPQFLASHIGTLEGTRVVDWSRVEAYCDRPAPNSTIAAQLDADVVIGGQIRQQNDVLHVFPVLYVREAGTSHSISEVKGPVAEYLKLRADVASKVQVVLEGAWVDGQWRMAEFSRKLPPEDDLQRGRTFLEKGELALAALHLERAVASRSVPDAHLYLGMVQIDQRKFSEAVDNLERFNVLREKSALGRRELGFAYAALRRYDAAIEQYKKAIELDPSIRGVRVEMGNAYFFQEKFNDAKSQYLKELEVSPRDPATIFNLGLVSERLSDSEGAVLAYETLLRIDSQHEGARRALAHVFGVAGTQAHYSSRDYAKAIREFSKAIDYWPTARGFFGRALSRAYETMGTSSPDYSASIEDYEQAVKLSTGVVADAEYRRWALINLAEAYVLMRKFHEATKTAQLAVKETRGDNPDRRLSLYLLVAAQMLSGDEHAADLALLWREVDNSQDKISDWDFSMLDKFYRDPALLDAEKRMKVLAFTDDFKKKAIAPAR